MAGRPPYNRRFGLLFTVATFEAVVGSRRELVMGSFRWTRRGWEFFRPAHQTFLLCLSFSMSQCLLRSARNPDRTASGPKQEETTLSPLCTRSSRPSSQTCNILSSGCFRFDLSLSWSLSHPSVPSQPGRSPLLSEHILTLSQFLPTFSPSLPISLSIEAGNSTLRPLSTSPRGPHRTRTPTVPLSLSLLPFLWSL